MTRRTKRYLLITAIFAVAVGGAFGLTRLKPPPERKEVANVDPLVEVVPLAVETVSFTIRSQGTVRPRTETVLSAEVAGVIVHMSPKFIAGGVFAEDEVLLEIDPTNYAVAVDQAEALVEQRRIEYEGARKLRSQGYRAEAEYAAAAAALASAEAELVRARRNLERTKIRLPYAGMVRAKEADLGQYVTTGSRLGVTFATDAAEVRLPLTDADLAFVDLPSTRAISGSGEAAGPPVTLTAERKGVVRAWEGRIVRSEGVVDERTRVTYAVARIDDPYGLGAGGDPDVALPMGTFVSAEIQGTTVRDVMRVPRSALRGNRQLVIADDNNRVEIRNVDVLRADAEYAYVSAGVSPGERLILTVLENPINGMHVRTEPDDDGQRIADKRDRGE